MTKSIMLEVITPSKMFYKGKCDLVIARTLEGDEGFMANHAWACKLLDVDELWIQEAGAKDFKVAAVAGGYIDVKDSIIIYTDAAEWQEDIDKDRAENLKKDAEAWIESHDDPHEIAKAQIALAKAVARMHVASGGRRGKR